MAVLLNSCLHVKRRMSESVTLGCGCPKVNDLKPAYCTAAWSFGVTNRRFGNGCGNVVPKENLAEA
jgi:hypothetical protein